MTDKTKEFIDKAKIVHGDKYDYSKVEYGNNLNEIIIICNEHGDFLQLPKVHKRGGGCPKCAGKNKTTNDFINESKNIHGDYYDYENTIYINAKTPVVIKCKIHGNFTITPNKHLSRESGCQKCSRLEKTNKSRDTKEEFIIKAQEIHGNKYDYSNIVYINNNTLITIKCKIHGNFTQYPHVHKLGNGCQKCGKNYRTNTNEFIEKAKIIHGNKYNYSKVDYKNSQTNITIICNIHGEFEQKPNNHLFGNGCSKCKFDLIRNIKRKTNEQFIEESIIVHGNKYNYSKVNYVDCRVHVIIICNEHGEFSQAPHKHLYGQGCLKCQVKKHYSKQQIHWLNYVQSYNNINIQHGENQNEYLIPNTRFHADGYCAETNTIYEYHGDFWHGNPNKYIQTDINPVSKKTFGELYQNTLNKEQQIRDLGFNLITIWESDWIKLNKCVKLLQRKFRISKLH
jgi:hypothetical protein